MLWMTLLSAAMLYSGWRCSRRVLSDGVLLSIVWLVTVNLVMFAWLVYLLLQ